MEIAGHAGNDAEMSRRQWRGNVTLAMTRKCHAGNDAKCNAGNGAEMSRRQ